MRPPTNPSLRRAQALTLAGFCSTDECRNECWAPIGNALLNKLMDSRVSTLSGLLTWLYVHDGPRNRDDLYTREYWAGRTRRAAAEKLWRRYQQWSSAERAECGLLPRPTRRRRARRNPAPERKATYQLFEVIQGGKRRPRSWPPPL